MHATIDLIESVGLHKLTVRAVAESAQVNVAAVNYHFGSKDKLIEVALETTLANMLEDLEDQVSRLPGAPEPVLVELLEYLMEGGMRFPNITRAHVHEMFVSDAKSAPLPLSLAKIIVPMARVLQDVVPGLEEEAALNRCVRAISSVFFPVFFNGFFLASGALRTPEARRRYVDELASEMLASVS